MEKAVVECRGCGSSAQGHKLREQGRHLKWWNRCDDIIIAVAVSSALLAWLMLFIHLRINASPPTPTHERRTTCYYRLGDARLMPSSIPEDLCTHLILSFGTVDSDSRINVTTLGGADRMKREIPALQLKGKRKVMISIGGGGNGSDNFSLMVNNPNLVKTFLDSCSELLEETGLDGIDYDWEFPHWSERYALSRLLEWTRVLIDGIGNAKNKSLELSVALPGPFGLSLGYSIDSLTRYCDFVNVMTYDLVLLNPILKQTAHHNALFSQGIPTYGVSYILKDKKVGYLHAPVKGYSEPPELSFNLAYARVCQLANLSGATTTWSQQSQVPYLNDGRGNWVSFDNVRSVEKKVDYAARHGLGGLMIFSLNADDHKGKCGEGEFPLTRAAQESWN